MTTGFPVPFASGADSFDFGGALLVGGIPLPTTLRDYPGVRADNGMTTSTTSTAPISATASYLSRGTTTTFAENAKYVPVLSLSPSDAATLAKNPLASNLKQRFSKVMPAVSMAALLSYAGYLAEPLTSHESRPEKLTVWLDDSSAGTWTGSEATGTSRIQHSQSTAIGLRPSKHDERSRVGRPIDPSVEDQPQFEYGQAIAYAQFMGLRTDFPL